MPGVGFAFHLGAVRPLATQSVAHLLELIRQAWPEGPIRDVDSRDALSCRTQVVTCVWRGRRVGNIIGYVQC